MLWAYPRERGGNGLIVLALVVGLGLSPRARGKLEQRAAQFGNIGPIPASAGETYKAAQSEI